MSWSFYDANGKILQGILADAVDTTELADDAVTTAKILADAVTNAKLANMATRTVKANATSGSANPTDVAMADGDFLIANGSALVTVPITGDVVIDNAGAAVIQTGAVDAAMFADATLATVGETNTGTNETKIITPNVLAGSNFGERVIQMVVVDFAIALTTGSKFYFHVPSTLNGFDIVDVHAEVITAGVGGNLITIDLHNVRHAGGDVDILSTNITINASATGSDTATTAAVINSGAGYDALATNDVIRVDIDQIGNTTAGSGLIVTLICRLP